MTIDLINNGWIKLHRKFTDWEWYNHLPTKVLFLHLILTANHKEAKWQGKTILRGQKITSLSNLALEVGLSVQQIRTAISNLKSTGEITQLITANYSLISITNYDKYQHINTLDNTPSTHEQQAINKLSTTNKNENKENKEKNNLLLEQWESKYGELDIISLQDWINKKSFDEDKIKKELEIFKSQCQAKGYKYQNFKAAFQKWCLNEQYGNGEKKFLKSTVGSY